MKNHTRPVFYGAEIFSALIFLCAMSAAFMYTLCRSVVFPAACVMTALSFGIYMLFYVLRKKKKFAVLAFIACFGFSMAVFSLMSSQSSVSNAVDFLFGASENYDIFMSAAFIPMISFIIGFTTAYFNVYLPRPAFLLLPALIPLMLASRTAGGLPAGYVVFMMVGFALVALGVSRPEFPSENTYVDDKKSRRERLAALGIFSVVLALVIFAVPRSNNTPLGHYVDNVFKQKSNFFTNNTLSNFTSSSSVNHGANNPSDDILFYASTKYPENLSRWSFDLYNGEKGWTIHPEYETGWSSWKTYKKNLNTEALASKLQKAANDGYLKDYAPLLKELSYIPKDEWYETVQMKIQVADGSSTKVILHPSLTTQVSINGYSGKVFRTYKDELFAEKNLMQNASYTLEYYLPEANESLINLFEQVDMEEILTAAAEEGIISYSERTSFLSERERAQEYHKLTLEKPINPEIVALAQEITSGLSSDYEKALAIEKWFGEAGFVYDLDFVPAETTAEYFIFKSKRGICTDFATASTLLLRAADIPAKYTEGFVLKEENRTESGAFAVKASNAHAYAMCYIEGFGWLEIDGTKYAKTAEEARKSDTFTAMIVLISAVLLTVLAIIFRRQISESAFALSLNFRNDSGKIRAVYLRTRKLACRIAEKEPKSTTSKEVCEIISNSLSMKKEAEEITACADELFYNNTINPCVKRLYGDYCAIYKMKKKMRK